MIPGRYMLCKMLYRKRLYHSVFKSSEKARGLKKASQYKQEKLEEKEGKMYEAGGY